MAQLASFQDPCRHCGTPVRHGAADDFCCPGCRAAWEILGDLDGQTWQKMRERFDARETPVQPTGRSFSEFDDPEFGQRYATTTADGLVQVQLFLPAIHCAACVWVIERVLARQDGIVRAVVDQGRQVVSIAFDPTKSQLSGHAAVLDRLGYSPSPAGAPDVLQKRTENRRRELIRLGVAGALAGNLMLLSAPLYIAIWTGISESHAALFTWLSMGLSIPVVFWCAAPFHRKSLAGIASGSVHIDTPVSIAILLAFAGSVQAVVTGADHVYFDSIAMLVFLLLAGRMLVQAGHNRAQDAVASILALGDGVTLRSVNGPDGPWVECDSNAVEPGDFVSVARGETFPVDGIVISGSTLVDESILTGESVPVPKAVDDRINAGTRNLRAQIILAADCVGDDRTIARIARAMAQAAGRRAPVVEWSSRLAGKFVTATLGLSALTWVAWSFIDPAVAIQNAVAVAVVLCPCALGLATPLAFAVATSRAGGIGALIKDSETIQRIAETRIAIVDKTGTLTNGHPTVVSWVGLTSMDGIDLRSVAAALEFHSHHPLSVAFDPWYDAGIAIDSVSESAGKGIEGHFQGNLVRIGTLEWLWHDDTPDMIVNATPPDPAATPVWLEWNGRVVACVWLMDELLPDAGTVVDSLKQMDMQVILLSGDRPQPVAETARKLGIECRYAQMDPTQKQLVVERANRNAPTLMVGDGGNDTPAMAAAFAAVAVRGSAASALAAGDAFLTKPGIGAVADLVRISRTALATVRQNVAISLVYNITGAVLAMTGQISPFAAALLMPASSLTVLVNSMRQAWLK